MTDRGKLRCLLTVAEALGGPEWWEALDAIVAGDRCYVFNPETEELEEILEPDEEPGSLTMTETTTYSAICAYRHQHGRAPKVCDLMEAHGVSESTIERRLRALRMAGRILITHGSGRSIRVVA